MNRIPLVRQCLGALVLLLGGAVSAGAQLSIAPPPGVPSVSEGQLLVVPLTISGAEGAVTVQALSPRGATAVLTGGGAELRWTPDHSVVHGRASERVLALVQVTDQSGREVSRPIMIDVQDVPRAPAVPSLSPVLVTPGTAVSQAISGVANPDGGTLEFEVDPVTLPPGASLTRQGSFVWANPAASVINAWPAGGHQVRFTAIANGVASPQATLVLQLNPDAQRPRVTLQSAAPERVRRGDEVRLSYRISTGTGNVPTTAIVTPVTVPAIAGIAVTNDYDAATGLGTARWAIPFDMPVEGDARLVFRLVLSDAGNTLNNQDFPIAVTFRRPPGPDFDRYTNEVQRATEAQTAIATAITKLEESRRKREGTERFFNVTKLIASSAGALFPTFGIGGGDTPERVGAIGAGTAAVIQLLQTANVILPSAPVAELIKEREGLQAQLRDRIAPYRDDYVSEGRRFEPVFPTRSDELRSLSARVAAAAESRMTPVPRILGTPPTPAIPPTPGI
jgi:hypothetical protein